MLRIYSVALTVARDAAVAAKVIGLQDVDLARQLRRAAASVPLNLAEGAGVFGGHRRQRYLTALGSAREVLAVLETGHMMGYCDTVADCTRDRLDPIIGTLVGLVRG